MASESPPRHALRPRTVGEILDASFRLYRLHFGRLLFVCFVVSIPTLAVAALLAGSFERLETESMDILATMLRELQRPGGPDPSVPDEANRRLAEIMSSRDAILLNASGLSQGFARGAAMVAMAFAAWAAASGATMPSAGSLLASAVRRFAPGAVVMTALTAGALCSAVLGPFAICGLILLLLVTGLLMATPAICALETGRLETSMSGRTAGLPGLLRALAWPLVACACTIDCIARAFSLGMSGWAFARATLFAAIALTLLSLFTSVIGALAGALATSWGVLFVVQHLAEVVLLPFLGLAFSLWYLDLRVRREGLDLRLTLDAAQA